MTNNPKKISVLGCGWLGLPLAEALCLQGHFVKGATTSPEKKGALQEKGITPYLITLSETGIEGNIIDFLQESEILILNIPPKVRHPAADNFVRKIEQLLPYIIQSSIQKVVFISSTSVYPDTLLSTDKVTESYTLTPDTESGQQLLQAEKLLMEHHHFQTTILRFGGLIGPGRHPVKHLAGKENLENPEAPINMIHLDDCIGIIRKTIMQGVWNETFNAVAPFHPTRETYYQQKAKEMQLALPTFAHNKSSVGKCISSEKIQKVLNYSFRKTDF